MLFPMSYLTIIQALAKYNANKFEELEALLILYTNNIKFFGKFRELFPSSSNKIVEMLKESVSQQVCHYFIFPST